VYQLAQTEHEVYEGNGNSECLFTKINRVHTLYLKEREAMKTETERLSRYQEYQHEILRIRAEHIVKLNALFKYMEESEWLIYVPPREAIEGWFNRDENLRSKMVIIFILVICFWVTIIGIYNKIYMREAVIEGVRVLDKIRMYAWLCFVLFILLELVYLHAHILSGLKSIGSMCGWLFGGCNFDARIETKFDTPHWGSGIVGVKTIVRPKKGT